MPFDIWISFVATYFAITVIPGPSVFMVTSQALTNGRPAAIKCALGDVAGDTILLVGSMFGISLLLASYPQTFSVLKWTGVVCVFALGLQKIAISFTSADPKAARPDRAAALGFATGLSNPKAMAFYVALLPSFIDPDRSLFAQSSVLMVTAACVGIACLVGYAFLAGFAHFLLAKPQMKSRADLSCGLCLVALGAVLGWTR
ncbi:hypothetical protein DL239_02320 [Sedimentitalea sp. CY04]|uniref:Threonine/homoserine/homoserine lactone efflux protein n=1 Tax=Parasedimentitalea denitrificans TaxID=2211118 RepID=A0ABX0W6J3_9RHOB|nr:LysE family translocator [Sedimentitalea sp. CY04]NIZ59806.1 hypothetical protein [Sedimentitalea sp. CY04]